MSETKNDIQNVFSGKNVLRFIIPSIIGVLIFLVPVVYDGKLTLILSLIINTTKSVLGASLLPISIIVLAVSAVLSLVGKAKPDVFKGFWKTLFVLPIYMLLVRIAAIILALLIYYQVGPEFIWSKNTGGLMLKELLTSLIPFFFWAGLFLPILTDFGLMEFIGSLFTKIFRPVFKIPGRAAVDCAASWIGSGTMGVVITDLQYKNGFYTGREAISIATGFSVVAFPIVVLFTEFLGIQPLFFKLYISVIIVGLITNVIMVRIPPISWKPNTYWDKAPRQGVAESSGNETEGLLSRAYRAALDRVSQKRDEPFIVSGLKIVGDVWFTLMPIVMTLGVFVTILAEYTPFFQWISFPFIFLLKLFGLPDAETAAPTLVVGFADIFLPFILGGKITAVITKFVIGTVALVQLIFMTEIGAILLKSPIPVNLLDLAIIFLERTLIALPIAVGLAYVFV